MNERRKKKKKFAADEKRWWDRDGETYLYPPSTSEKTPCLSLDDKAALPGSFIKEGGRM